MENQAPDASDSMDMNPQQTHETSSSDQYETSSDQYDDQYDQYETDDQYDDEYETSDQYYPQYETSFDQYYHAISGFHNQNDFENGNKVLMPLSALDRLSSLVIDYPMMFRIESYATGRHSHCGVLEFVAEEGFVVLPSSMMKNMELNEGDLVNLKNTSLPKGNYMKIQPHLTKFCTLTDHKSLLEKAMKDFACVTVGDTIVINHMDDKYFVDILEAKPSPAICLIDTDCEVDFAPPLDYKEPEKQQKKDDDKDRTTKPKDEVLVPEFFKPFTGVGRRLDEPKGRPD